MKTKWIIFSTAFALFSMFFGSGNLVFPITVGQESEGHYGLAAMGIVLTGVIVPFLGVFGMLLYKGNFAEFFAPLGKRGTFWFSLAALALMGPFGVLARCLTVAHGAIELLFPSLDLWMSSLLLSGVIFVLTVNKNKIVSILGTVLTPFLLLSIGAIAYFGLTNREFTPALEGRGVAAFTNGFFQGYQTMDLLAAFFFSTFVIAHLKNSAQEEAGMTSLFFKAGLLSAAILSTIYVVLVMLGWVYAPILASAKPQEMLGLIALASLGKYAAPCVCIAVVLACLTTAIVLASLFADFLKKEVTQDKLGSKFSLLVTLVISFMVSTLDFAGIARFLGPILEAVYPALIVLTVGNIAFKLWDIKPTHWPATITLAIKMCCF